MKRSRSSPSAKTDGAPPQAKGKKEKMKRNPTEAVKAAVSDRTASNSKSSKKSDSKSATVAVVPAKPQKDLRNALVVVGTYHSVMAGLVFRKEKFYMKFSIKHHVGCLNAVAVTEKYIASCGVDERVFLFTNKAEQNLTAALRHRMAEAGEPIAVRLADLGSITPPSEVTCLRFTQNSQFLLCGCADGQLLMYRTRDWALSQHWPVHERGISGIAVHPGSGGSLAVSIGVDRMVAVMDLAKGRLLTKWKYTSTIAAAAAPEPEAEEEQPSTTTDGQDAPQQQPHKKKVKVTTFARLQRLEEPITVQFSPSGNWFLVQGRHSLVVYESATMEAYCVLQLERPQPEDEMHTCTFLDDNTVVVGNEAGQLLVATIPAVSGNRVLTLSPVSCTYPPAVAEEAAKLLATAVRPEMECRVKNPLRHVSRVKAVFKEGNILFSTDTNGIVLARRLIPSSSADGKGVSMQYVTSANCQGRVTSLDVLPL